MVFYTELYSNILHAHIFVLQEVFIYTTNAHFVKVCRHAELQIGTNPVMIFKQLRCKRLKWLPVSDGRWPFRPRLKCPT